MVRHRFRTLTLIVLAVVASVSILAVSTRRRSTAVVVNLPIVHSSNTEPEQQLPEGAPRDVVLVTLLPTGFEPTEVTHRAEPFLLVVQNRSEKINPTFTYDWNFGKTKKPKRIPRKKDSQGEVVNLQPGTYNIGLTDRPSWNCKLIITQN